MKATTTAASRFSSGACLNPDCVRSAARSASRRLAVPTWRAVALSSVVSVAAHLSALAAFAPGETVQIAGGAPVTLAALGNSFADFSRGATPAQPVTTRPSPAATAQPATGQARPSAPVAAAPAPEGLTLTAPESAEPVVPLVAEPSAAHPDASPSQLSALAPQNPTPSDAAPIPPARPQPLAGAAPATASETIMPVPEVTVQQAHATTPRPQRRPEPQPQPSQQATERAQTAPASAPQAAGNAEQDARRGAADGAASARAAASGNSGAAGQAGNVAVSNYPGQVMERIRRTRQQRVAGRGVAVVSFSVADGGTLASASILRSSGNPAIDAAALAHIQRAAPFPAPPAGAGRSFSFEFVVR